MHAQSVSVHSVPTVRLLWSLLRRFSLYYTRNAAFCNAGKNLGNVLHFYNESFIIVNACRCGGMADASHSKCDGLSVPVQVRPPAPHFRLKHKHSEDDLRSACAFQRLSAGTCESVCQRCVCRAGSAWAGRSRSSCPRCCAGGRRSRSRSCHGTRPCRSPPRRQSPCCW